jgi:uncharacterized coiled-coil DUF342 family protein
MEKTISAATKMLLTAAQKTIDDLRKRLSDLGAENMENKSKALQNEILITAARSELSDYERTVARLRAENKSLRMELEQNVKSSDL